ncbi:MAG: DUF87 domain-containing protein [Verrucomicrobia bacterium]|nr:DUF87 domain-containing protein [Verrucomicrobiota bacterium]
MPNLESIHTSEAKPLLSAPSDHRARRPRRERIAAPRSPRHAQEGSPPNFRAEVGESKFLRVVENRERGTSDAEFVLELAGVICNGQTPNNLTVTREAISTNGDRLASRLIPLLGTNAEACFTFKGGEETNFGWSIAGAIREARSKEDAIAQAVVLQQNVQMLLASEPSFCFVPREVAKIERAGKSIASWRTRVAPLTLSLNIPCQTTLGFASTDQRTDVISRTLRFSVPRAEKNAFRSLAEAVVLNAEPVSLQVNFAGFTLDDLAQAGIRDAVDWIQRHPAQFRAQLRTTHIASELAEHIQDYLHNWLENPMGARVRCSIISPSRPSPCFVAILGGDVFGARVEAVGCLPVSGNGLVEASPTEVGNHELDLGSCLHADARWPSLFPSFESIANARVRRLFNNEVPDFGKAGVVLGEVAEGSQEPVRLSEACRSQHVYILGATGTGKSTLIFNMILQDISSGRGVGLVDPHGDLYDQLLEAMPLSRSNDVVLFNPGNLDCSPGINPLECSGPNRSLQVNFIINELLKTFERLYDMRHCGGPVFEMYFRNAMLLLMESGLEEVALTEFALVFEDSEFRKFLKNRCKNALVVNFWNNQAEKAKGDLTLENMTPYIASKINAFTSNVRIPTQIGHPLRFKSDRHYDSDRTPVPIEIGQGFRFEIGQFSGRS